MASPDEHARLYGKLRASLLARHFAFSRYFRVNYLSLFNSLGSLHQADPPSTSSPTQDDLELDSCRNWLGVKPDTYKNADELNDLGNNDPDQEQVERWRVFSHGRENPLMFSGQLLTCLAIEHHFGVGEALPIIRDALRSIGSMYKFKDTDHFKGYIIRWDPMTDDNWVTEEQGGQSRPRYCCDFFLGEDRDYLYCTPFNHPAYVPPTFDDYNDPKWVTDERAATNPDAQFLAARERYECLENFRSWEPSMDELVGLIAGYTMVFELVEDQEVRDAVREQVNDLGDYLAEHGYMLVRPLGGFTARGASGSLPALEFPFGRVFARITGNAYGSRATFKGACEKAGIWPCAEDDLWRAELVGALSTGLCLGLLYLSAFVGPPAAKLLGLDDEYAVIALIREGLTEEKFGSNIGIHLGRAFGIRQNRGCFDVWGYNYRGEFPAAYLLKQIDTQKRFHIFMRIISISSGVPAVGFAPFIGLSNYKDSNTLVGGYYREWYLARRRRGRDPQQGEGSRTGFANAVAALLGAQGAEADLIAYLDETYENFVNELGEDLALHPPTNASDDPSHVTEEIFNKEPGWYKDNALEYMTCLALSWMHFEDRRNEGVSPSDIRVPGFPSGPTSTWLSRPTVPGAVAQEESVPALVGCDITGTQPVDPFEEEEGIPEGPSASARLRDECREKGPVPPPDLGEIEEVELHTFTVGEDQSDVNTGIDLYTYDSVSFEASGSIWAGVWFTGENGPKGWEDWITSNRNFPLHEVEQAHPFSLLYKVAEELTVVIPGGITGTTRTVRTYPGRYYYLGNGEGAGFVNMAPGKRRLLLRINDDVPGNGSGSFACTVRVQRVKR